MQRTPAITLLALSLSASLVAAAPAGGASAAAAAEEPSPAVTTSAPYAPRSAFLRDPEEAKAFAVRSANFWVRHAFDPLHGGTFADLDQQGLPSREDRRKSSNHQSRNAYALTRAYMLTGDDRYLEYARNALNFLYRHSWDKANGGWFAVHNRDGSLSDNTLNRRKDAFYQHYALLGIAAAVEAENRSSDRAWLKKGYASLENGLWDDTKGQEGYFATAVPDWSTRTGKSFNATVDALTTHAFALHHLTGDPAHEDRVVELAEQALTHLVGSAKRPRPGSLRSADTQFGFAQEYNADWTVFQDPNPDRTNDDRVFVGHVLKTAWVLLRANAVSPDERYVDAARDLIQEVWTHDPPNAPAPERPDDASYDHERGGVLSNYFWATGQISQPPQKLWWEQEQAFMAGLMHWDATGDEDSLRMADESIDFFARHFEDRSSVDVNGKMIGEVYESVTPAGAPLQPRKASINKAGYHSAETGYLGYLYGNLLYHHRPVTLHYRFQAKGRAQRVMLTPLEIEDERLRIRRVTLDGRPFCRVDRAERTLVIPPRVGGEFAVQFEVVDAADASPGDRACRASR